MRHSLLMALALLAWLPATVRAENDSWKFDASLNLFAAGMSGEIGVRGQPVVVDLSASDIFENLSAAAAGRFTVGYERWFFSTEFSYLELEVESTAVNVELKQWLVEPSVGYEFCEFFRGFAGARYNSIEAEVIFLGPPLVGGGTEEWWDPIIGVEVSLPLVRGKLSFDGRFDVGGFGIGSDFTWQAYPHFDWRFAKWGSAQLGYRWLGTDYEDGSGLNRFVYDVVVQGFQLGLTFHF